MDKDTFEQHLKSRGLKLTPERTRIFKAVSAMNSHFEPEDVLMRLQGQKKRVSRASVYRTLPLLLECGLIKEAIYKDRKTRYERTFGRNHHDHMVCEECGAIIEFVSEKIERLQAELCRERDFEASSHTLEIRGRCRVCR